ncbi:MAG: helix-turn-helix domain-containing protein [Pseudonocardiaceae bacterium]|nr:helix-turn-helix domain-containing protein [Pseudonocardiaceae bacterium]
MEFVFQTRSPDGVLGRFVESVFYARGRIEYRRERIAPTGSTVAGIVLGAPIRQTPDDGAGPMFEAGTGFLIGPHDRPIVNEPLAETYCVGIVTTPVGCRVVFGVDPAPLRGRVVDLTAAWPAAADLRERLLAMSDPASMLDLVGQTLAATLDPPTPGVDRCARAVRALEDDPACNIGELAKRLGVTHGHLDREFTRVVGVSPRTLARTLRVRTLLENIDVYGQIAWVRLAAELGWFDQAHLIRDFKRHTGVTPSQYQAAQRDRFRPEEAAPGFVPDTT